MVIELNKSYKGMIDYLCLFNKNMIGLQQPGRIHRGKQRTKPSEQSTWTPSRGGYHFGFGKPEFPQTLQLQTVGASWNPTADDGGLKVWLNFQLQTVEVWRFNQTSNCRRCRVEGFANALSADVHRWGFDQTHRKTSISRRAAFRVRVKPSNCRRP